MILFPESLENHCNSTMREYLDRKNKFQQGDLEKHYFLEDTELGGEPEEGNWSMDFPLEIPESVSYLGANRPERLGLTGLR